MPRHQMYTLRANWQHASGRGEEIPEPVPSTRSDDGDERIYVRQQLRLGGQTTTSMVTCGLYAKQDGRETLLGDFTLDANDPHSKSPTKHQLHLHGRVVSSMRMDDHGRPVPTTVRASLWNPAWDTDAQKDREGAGAR